MGAQLVLMFIKGVARRLGRTASHDGAGMWDLVLFKSPALMNL